MALIEFEATSLNLEFHLSAEAMATHRLLMPVRRGAIAHGEFVQFGEHFGLVRPEILKAPLSLDAIHTAIAHSEEWLDRLHKLFPKIGSQLFKVVALQKILLGLLKNALSAPRDSGLLGPDRPPRSIELRGARRRRKERAQQEQKRDSTHAHDISEWRD
jgi:hypothetical protein